MSHDSDGNNNRTSADYFTDSSQFHYYVREHRKETSF